MNQSKGASKVSIVMGLLLATGFFYLAFRNLSFEAVWDRIRMVSAGQLLLAIGTSLAVLLVRGMRWWLLLPAPVRSGEFMAAQRASALGYGVTNLATRLGELVRIAVFSRDTRRNPAEVTATVVVDRLLFDFLAFACFFAYALFGYRQQITALFPGLETGFQVFLGVTVLGILGLVALARFPHAFLRLFQLTGLPRVAFVWRRLEPLFHQLIDGLNVCRNPWRLLLVQLVNLLAWGLGVVYFQLTLSACGIDLPLPDLVLMFTISTFGIIVPSPGGLGSFHYFVALGLTGLYGIGQDQAAAAATYAHGLNYILISIVALLFFIIGRRNQPFDPEP